MAFNLKTFGIRTLSAAVFVTLFLGSVMMGYLSFSLFFLIVALGALVEFYNIAEKLGARPFKFWGYAAAFVLYLLSVNWNYLSSDLVPDFKVLLFPYLAVTSCSLLLVLMLRKDGSKLEDALFTVMGILYVVLPFCFLHQLVFQSSSVPGGLNYKPELMLGIIFLIWSNDTFAYLGGSFFGRHKLIERVSPGKTIEGTVFGVLVSFILSYLIDYLLNIHLGRLWLIFGFAVPLFATAGDLIESFMKRQAGIKDSGSIMPGHGGFLDRFDSLLFVSPCVILLLKLSQL